MVIRVALCVAPLAGVVAACSPAPHPPRPTVVIVTLDTTRRDHLSAYGYAKDTSPFLRELCERSLRFDGGVSPATWTLPAHVSLFTGQLPEEHGCWPRRNDDEGARSVSPSTVLLAQRLADIGYRTVAAVGGPFPTSRYGVLRGFQETFEPELGRQRSGAELNAWLAGALAREGADARPLLLFVNYFDAHSPYDPPEDLDYPFAPEASGLHTVLSLANRSFASPEEEARELAVAREQYDRELFVQDRALADLWSLLERNGYLADALVIVTADHGEMFGEQPFVYGHGCAPYEPVINVPLVVHRTGRAPGVERRPVSTRAIHATVLAAVGLARPTNGPGAYDLLALPDAPAAPYAEHRTSRVWLADLRFPDFKYGVGLVPTPEGIELGRGALIDLATNPDERLDRAFLDPTVPQAAAARAELRRRIDAWREPPGDHERVELDADEAQNLDDLGYGG